MDLVGISVSLLEDISQIKVGSWEQTDREDRGVNRYLRCRWLKGFFLHHDYLQPWMIESFVDGDSLRRIQHQHSSYQIFSAFRDLVPLARIHLHKRQPKTFALTNASRPIGNNRLILCCSAGNTMNVNEEFLKQKRKKMKMFAVGSFSGEKHSHLWVIVDQDIFSCYGTNTGPLFSYIFYICIVNINLTWSVLTYNNNNISIYIIYNQPQLPTILGKESNKLSYKGSLFTNQNVSFLNLNVFKGHVYFHVLIVWKIVIIIIIIIIIIINSKLKENSTYFMSTPLWQIVHSAHHVYESLIEN